MAETFGLAYTPTYGVVFTFVLLVVALAFRPEGLMGVRK
jgi:branched-chain amino acid transport system permease protein